MSVSKLRAESPVVDDEMQRLRHIDPVGPSGQRWLGIVEICIPLLGYSQTPLRTDLIAVWHLDEGRRLSLTT